MNVKTYDGIYELASVSYWKIGRHYDEGTELNLFVIQPAKDGNEDALLLTYADGTSYLLANVLKENMRDIQDKLYRNESVDLTELFYLYCETDTECPFFAGTFMIPWKALVESPYQIEKFARNYLIIALHDCEMSRRITNLKYEELVERFVPDSDTDDLEEVDFEDEVDYDDDEESFYEAEDDEDYFDDDADMEEELDVDGEVVFPDKDDEEVELDVQGEEVFYELEGEINPQYQERLWNPEYCPFS